MEKNLNGRLLQQIAASPTAFHAVDTARRALSAAGFPILMMRRQDMSLEDIFMSLTDDAADGKEA